MLFLKYLLTSGGIAMMVIAAGILVYDFYLEIRHRQTQAMPEAAPTAAPHIRWRTSLALALLAWGPLLIAAGIVVVPSGMAGVRVSQTKGTLPGTLYPGAHFVTPLAENVALFDTRDQLFTTGESEDAKAAAHKAEPLNVQAKEGLTLGLAIQCGIASIPSISITSRRICLSRWRKKSFLLLSPVHGASWFRTIPFAMSSRPSAKKSVSAPPEPLHRNSLPMESS